jgi:hypothetical protein
LNDLKEYGYSVIDDCSNTRHLMKMINNTALDVCKAKIMDSSTLHGNFVFTVELHSAFIKQTKADNPQMNVSEVNYSSNKQGGGNNASNKLGSSGISNYTNADIADRFNEVVSILLYLVTKIIPSASSA